MNYAEAAFYDAHPCHHVAVWEAHRLLTRNVKREAEDRRRNSRRH
jgi:hypothetical protein